MIIAKQGRKIKFEKLESSLLWSLLPDRGFIILAGLKTLGIPKDFYFLLLKHVSLLKDMIEVKRGKIELMIFKRYSYIINSMISKRCVIKKGMNILKVLIMVILGIIQTKEWS
jgi:hypothetical protein